MEDESKFFDRMLFQIEKAFEVSDIKRLQNEQGRKWSFQLCALPLRRGKNLLVGLNWGAYRTWDYPPQTHHPDRESYSEVRSWNFISRSVGYLDEYFSPIEELNYINVSPFRSEEANDLTSTDWKLSINRFFLETIDFLNPDLTLVLGHKAIKKLDKHGQVQHQRVTTQELTSTGRIRKVSGYIGTIKGLRSEHKFVAVPHPNNKIQKEARDKIWKKVFSVLS